MKIKCFNVFMILSFLVFSLTGKGQVFSYSIEWGGNRVFFSEISGLDLGLPVSGIRTSAYSANSPVKTTRIVNPKTISLKYVTCKTDNELYRWFCTFNLNTREKRDLTVKLLNQNGEPVKIWKVLQAFPVKVEGPSLTARGNDVTIESVVLAHEGIEPE